MNQKKYRKKEQQLITAVQLELDTEGFNYQKWGGTQLCLPGDWLVNNNGECYTIADASFTKTYSEISPGRYKKTSVVWATEAVDCGKVKTREGYTEYSPGDFIVSNDKDGADTYAVLKADFESMYEEVTN